MIWLRSPCTMYIQMHLHQLQAEFVILKLLLLLRSRLRLWPSDKIANAKQKWRHKVHNSSITRLPDMNLIHQLQGCPVLQVGLPTSMPQHVQCFNLSTSTHQSSIIYPHYSSINPTNHLPTHQPIKQSVARQPNTSNTGYSAGPPDKT